jgi:hypothetical protein
MMLCSCCDVLLMLRCCLVISNFKLTSIFLHGYRYAVRQLNRLVILQLQEVKGKWLHKKQQMGLIFHLFDRGLPMLEYEASVGSGNRVQSCSPVVTE